MLPAGTPLSDWLRWLETLSPTEIDLGLDRVDQTRRDDSVSGDVEMATADQSIVKAMWPPAGDSRAHELRT